MKTVTLLGTLLLASGLARPRAAASTQEGGPGTAPAAAEEQKPQLQQPSHGELLLRLTESLELSAEQQKKVQAVLEQNKPEMERLEAEMKAAAERMRKAMFRAKENIRETLDMEQKEKLDAAFSRLMMRRGQRHAMTGGPGMQGHGEKGRRHGEMRMPRHTDSDHTEAPPPQEAQEEGQ